MDCEYTDTFAPTRTEILEDYLARLQSRVDQLESSHTGSSEPVQAPITCEWGLTLECMSVLHTCVPSLQ